MKKIGRRKFLEITIKSILALAGGILLSSILSFTEKFPENPFCIKVKPLLRDVLYQRHNLAG